MNDYITFNGIKFNIRRIWFQKNICVEADSKKNFTVKAPFSADSEQIADAIRAFFKDYCSKRQRAIHYYADGELFWLNGSQYPLYCDLACKIRRIEFYDGAFHLRPLLSEEQARAAFGAFYYSFLGEKLRELLPPLCKKIGAGPSHVHIKDVRTIWGSRSSSGGMTFNVRLALVRNELIEYIIIHELCHIFEMNHSAKFWQLVEVYCPNWKLLRDELKRDNMKYNW